MQTAGNETNSDAGPSMIPAAAGKGNRQWLTQGRKQPSGDATAAEEVARPEADMA